MKIPCPQSHWWPALLRRWKILTLAALFIAGAAMLLADRLCAQAARDRIHLSIDSLPARDVALVLGTAKTTRSGRPNLHFNQRMAAAAQLYHAGKVKHLLVSGDNHIRTYDEPSDMREALLAAGVPSEAITCDYAGFRTLDSMLRARSVFGLHRFIIVTEAFHCPRALWIARRHQLDAMAFAAPDVESAHWTLRVKAREILARVWCALDLYVTDRQPKFPGPPEPIELSVFNP